MHIAANGIQFKNLNNEQGSLEDVIRGKDVFVEVGWGDLLNRERIKSMAESPVVFAWTNSTSEIMPSEAKAGGAVVVGTGRSDMLNQVNSILVFPGIFRGTLDTEAPVINYKMKLVAAHALAQSIEKPNAERVLPSPLDKSIA